MQVLKGKYNYAKVMTDNIDDTTKDQIVSMLNHPAFKGSNIVIQADCHAGCGAVIGFTATMNKYIIPNIVGVDIGCGMLMGIYDVGDINLEGLDDFIKRNIPAGFSINDKVKGIDSSLNKDIMAICATIGIDNDRALKSVGTLGGGNHFIEAGRMRNGKLAITIHSGSRNFGLQIANYYQAIAKEQCDNYFINLPKQEFLLVDSIEGQAYLKATKIAQRYATANRVEMLNRISAFIGKYPDFTHETIHNYIGEDNIIRKGSIAAHTNEVCILPFNMADGIALCYGKSNNNFNYSAPHGAGRVMGRREAKRKLDMPEFTKRMQGIYTTTAVESTIDEAPMAYKPMAEIVKNTEDTLDIIEVIKPIYNFKSV